MSEGGGSNASHFKAVNGNPGTIEHYGLDEGI